MTSLPIGYSTSAAKPREVLPPRLRLSEDSEWMRRAVNVLVAAIGLLVTAPLLFLLGILIKLTSPGPVFYTQTRVGLDRRGPLSNGGNRRRHQDLGGKPFTIFKLRTMRWVPPADEQEVWATPDDPRITRLGAFLRKCRLDEIPQLWNVLRGDMNVVGPRPEQPGIFVELREQVDWYAVRQQVRPGITGWAQINHHYDQNIDDVRRKVSHDLEYVARRSTGQDLKIMLMTVPVLLLKKGGW